ncbi:MAG: class I adenylate-forming enzyme family protein [Microthrixaceae bacterium]
MSSVAIRAFTRCAVVGSPDPEWGQRVVAVVVSESPTDMPTLESIRDFVKATMPAASAPKELVITDTLPKTSSGKIRRRLAVQVDIERPSGGSHHSNDS